MNFRPQVPAEEINRRIGWLKRLMAGNGLDAALIVQPVDLYYYSGTAQSGYLYLPLDSDPVLMVRRDAGRADQESPLNVVPIASTSQVPGLVKSLTGKLPKCCGLEFDILPVREYYYYRRLFPGTSFKDASALILGQRAIKSAWEISRMENTARVSKQAFEDLRQQLKPGWSELKAASIIEAAARVKGHEGKLRIRHFRAEGYSGHLLSGKDGALTGAIDSPASGRGPSAAFPYGAGYKPIVPGEPVMVDFSCVVEGYHMDETRMFAIGQMPGEVREAVDASVAVYQDLLEFIRPGITCDQVYSRSVACAAQIGWKDAFLGPPGAKVKFVGHGIGLELVEEPLLARGREEVLRAGMVFALEPKFVVDKRFIAGIENVVQLTDKGPLEISRTPLEIYLCAGSDQEESGNDPEI